MKKIEDYPYVMTIPQLAEFLGISKPTAYELARRTNLPTIKLTDAAKSNVRVLRDDVVRWLESRKNASA